MLCCRDLFGLVDNYYQEYALGKCNKLVLKKKSYLVLMLCRLLQLVKIMFCQGRLTFCYIRGRELHGSRV